MRRRQGASPARAKSASHNPAPLCPAPAGWKTGGTPHLCSKGGFVRHSKTKTWLLAEVLIFIEVLAGFFLRGFVSKKATFQPLDCQIGIRQHWPQRFCQDGISLKRVQSGIERFR